MSFLFSYFFLSLLIFILNAFFPWVCVISREGRGISGRKGQIIAFCIKCIFIKCIFYEMYCLRIKTDEMN